MCVPRLTIIIVAWLLKAVSPLARVEIGTAANIDLRGNGPCGIKWRRSAPLQTVSTASVGLTACLRWAALTASSDRPIDANAWVSDTVVPRRVRAASARLLTRLPAAAAPCPSSLDGAVLPAFCDAICDSTPTVPGIALSASIV